MIDIRRNWIVRRELWFDEPWRPDGADMAVFYHWSKPVNPEAALEVHSLELDLARGEAEIFKAFTSTTRNLVNRAVKEGLTAQIWTAPPRETIAEFLEFKGRFDGERGMNRAAPVWMYDYAAQRALFLSCARAPDGRPLVWHSYSVAPGWVRLLHSVSVESTPEERKIIGWANRLLHWEDIRACRASGIARYDFGGWYNGSEDEKLLGINAFKEQFGGAKTVRYHSMLPVTAKAKLYLEARARLKRSRALPHYV